MNFLYKYFLLCLLCSGPVLLVSAQQIDFDYSSSPYESGMSSQGFVEIDWGKFNSRINFILDRNHAVSAESGFDPSLRYDASELIQLDLIPYSFNYSFGPVLGSAYFGAGIYSISDSFKSIFYDDLGSIADNPGDYVSVINQRDAFLLSPRVGIRLEQLKNDFPLTFYFSGFISPIYFLILDQEMQYDFLAAPVDNRVSRFSSPYFEYGLNVSIFTLFSLNFEHIYQRLDFQTFDWDESGLALIPVDDIQVINLLKIGLDLIFPVMDRINILIGVYREFKNIESSYWGRLSETENWRFRFGFKL